MQRMSVLGTIGICLLASNGAVFAALVTRKSRPGLRARLFNWVIRNESKEPHSTRERHSHTAAANGSFWLQEARWLVWDSRGWSSAGFPRQSPARPASRGGESFKLSRAA